ncbi:hypothetical protein AZI87_13025 [Bdellovibrio bacteriovorus]|uniref:SGNH/GDSL hydrolase family protein n=1 Tax=Bdellovibrio bacteriovorus TaxID=959 RepID=A0A161QFF6_BDEBC|nr:hypothetical protein [Bdellovibrio bacteriovorus]KYG64165.1 hypothetical protein AZI87_13025 [Bdellovibrio bacteriovorus]
MSKFIKKIFILFLPFSFLYSVFIINDYNNYWGFRRNFHSYKGIIIYRFRDYMRAPKKNIIIGDSRVAHFDEATAPYLKEDQSYSNLAFGGASMLESIEMFWWAAKQQKLENVIMSISFYTMNKNYNTNRFFERLKLAENPGKYLVNLEYFKLTLNDALFPIEATENPVASYETYRKYADAINSVVADNYEINMTVLESLKNISEYCKKNNINLVFVTPPMHPSIWTSVVNQKKLFDEINFYKNYLAQLGPILDNETPNNLITLSHASDFSDGFHLKPTSEGFFKFKSAVMNFASTSKNSH